MDDLFQIGCIGLMKAIDNFDTSVGVKFSTYAVPMIIGEIRRYLRDNSSYRIPRSLRDIAYKAMQAKERLAKMHKRNRLSKRLQPNVRFRWRMWCMPWMPSRRP